MKNRFFKLFIVLSLVALIATGCHAFSFRNMTLDFVHITDTHIADRQSTTYKALGNSKELLADAVEQINNIVGLDFVLFSGDMIDSYSSENFHNFYKIISKLKYPSLNAFGNHEFYGTDSKEEVLNIVKKYNLNYIFDDTYYAFSPKTDFRIIVLDATIKDSDTATGELPKDQLDFLDKELFENQDKVVIIAMHHAAVEPFVERGHAMHNAKEMTDILTKYKNPIVVLSGHYHAAKIRRIGNIVFVSSPALVTYPMGFRHIKITNYKDRVAYDFDFIDTRLTDIKEQNRQTAFSYATLAGLESDRKTQFIYNKRHSKSIRYKRNKIKQVNKITKTSKRQIKKLSQRNKNRYKNFKKATPKTN